MSEPSFFHNMGTAFDVAAEIRHTGEARAAELKARRKSVTDAAGMLTTYMNAGQSADQAMVSVAKLTGLDPDALQSILPRAAYLARATRTRTRNREIMQFAARGWTDAEIGDRFALHPKSVNRIISKERKAA